MKKIIRKFIRHIDGIMRDYFAPYIVMDNMGTVKQCWTMKEAEDWLPYCGKHATIMETYDYAIQVERLQHN